MDTAQWPQQGIEVVKGVERKKPYKEQALNCPRCNSTNTKFCYYNNYSLSQPRYFCKTCRRYWTEGGSLRNVPVGGGSRKNKRSSSSSTSPLASTSTTPATIIATSSSLPSSTNLHQPSHHELNNIPLASSKFYQGGHDLNLSFPNQNLGYDQFGGLPSSSSVAASAAGGSLSALEFLRSGISARGLMGQFAPAASPGSLFGSGLVGFQELMRPSNVKLPLDGVGGVGYGGNMHQVLELGGGRLLFPFEDLKQVPAATIRNASDHEDVENGVVQGQGDPTLFWNDIMGNGGGGGGSW